MRCGKLWKTHHILLTLNATFLSLIPKLGEVVLFDQFKLISLCNAIYKIITKVISNRLNPILPYIVSPEQLVFLEGHQIMDGIILTHEILHSLKTTRTPSMMLKLDITKAYEKLNW